MSKNYGCELVDGVWWELTDTFYGPIVFDRLLPQDWPLYFHNEFILEVATNPNLDCVGIYTNGWEL
jgi:hypothetical protein